MEEEKDDRLSNFFRSRLNSDLEESDWSTPPASVLSNAFEELDLRKKRKKRRFFIWIVWIGSIGLIGALALSYSLKLSRLEDEIVQLKQHNEIEGSINGNTNKEGIIGREKDVEKSLEIKAFANKQLKVERRVDKKSGVAQVKRTIPIKESSYPIILGKTRKKEVFLFSTEENETTPEIKRKIIDYGEVSYKQTIESNSNIDSTSLFSKNINKVDSLVAIELETIDSSSALAGKKTITPLSMKKGYLIGFYFGLNSSNLSMSSDVVLPNNLTKYDNNYFGFQIGGRVQKSIYKDRLFIRSEIGYSKVKNKSVFAKNEVYDVKKLEIIGPGEAMYKTEYNFESPMGSFTKPVEFSVVFPGLDNGEVLVSKMDMETKFQIWNLYLGTSYKLLEGNWIDFDINAGLQGNYISEMRQEMNYNLTAENTMLSNRNYTLKSLSTINHQFLSLKVGAGFSLRKGAFVYGFEGNYHKSLQSIRNVDSPMNIRTQLNQIQTNFSLGILL